MYVLYVDQTEPAGATRYQSHNNLGYNVYIAVLYLPYCISQVGRALHAFDVACKVIIAVEFCTDSNSTR